MNKTYQDEKDIFFSHSSQDQKALSRLKDFLCKKLENDGGHKVKIFLSSDGESIPFGKNWVYELEEALDGAKIMFVFLSPNSINSHWIYFEAGIAYKNEIDVIPVGIMGVDLSSDVGMPLSLLQGFNIQSELGLNNIISKINKIFGWDCKEYFTEEEFREIFADVYGFGRSTFGEYISTINLIRYEFDKKIGNVGESYIDFKAKKYGVQNEKIENLVSRMDIDASKRQRWLFQGWEFVRYLDDENNDVKFCASIDPLAYPIAIKFLDEMFSKDLSHNDIVFKFSFIIQVEFVSDVYPIRDEIKAGAKMIGSDIAFADDREGYYSFGKAKFMLDSSNPTLMNIKHTYTNLDEFDIGVLISQLWEYGVLQRGRTVAPPIG
jgi:hypothetical protein